MLYSDVKGKDEESVVLMCTAGLFKIAKTSQLTERSWSSGHSGDLSGGAD